MEFKDATDCMMARGIALPEIAAAVGVAYTTVRASRLARGSSSRRPPPDGWEKALAKLARKRARELDKLASELEG